MYATPWSLGALTDGTGIGKDPPKWKSCLGSSEGNNRQKCWRKVKGPHNPVKPQSAMRWDKGGKVGLPTHPQSCRSWLLEQSHRERGSLQDTEVLRLCPHPGLNTEQINAKVTLLPWLPRLERQ